MSQTPSGKVRLTYLDVAKGIAIILVVMGHLMARSGPPGPDWYLTFHRVLYLFHMPLFMALAGMTFGSALPRALDISGYPKVVFPRIQRLILPYIAFGLIIVAGKMLAAHVIHVDNQPQSFGEELRSLLLFPRRGATSFLWFIYVLMMYHIIVTFLVSIVRVPVELLLLLGIVANFFEITDFLLLNEVFEFLPFFCLGIILMRELAKLEQALDAWGWIFIGVFAVALAIATYSHVPKWLLGLLSIPAVVALSKHLPSKLSTWLCLVGVSTFSIYLMNTIFIGLTKAALLPVLPWNDSTFVVFFVACSVLGTLAPLAVGRWAKRTTPRIGRYL